MRNRISIHLLFSRFVPRRAYDQIGSFSQENKSIVTRNFCETDDSINRHHERIETHQSHRFAQPSLKRRYSARKIPTEGWCSEVAEMDKHFCYNRVFWHVDQQGDSGMQTRQVGCSKMTGNIERHFGNYPTEKFVSFYHFEIGLRRVFQRGH